MKIRWGIVGLGNIAHKFAQDLQLVDDGELYAVASRSMSKAQEFSDTYDAKAAYGSYEALFNDSNVDIVYIATPHNYHEALSIMALKNKQAVLCEKPIAVNTTGVKNMIQASRDNKTFLMEAFWTRFNPVYNKVTELISAGEIGAVNYINVDFSFYRDDSAESRMLNMDLAGGALMDMGVYPVFLCYNLMGIPKKIDSSAIFHETGADLQTMSIFTYDEGLAYAMTGFRSRSDMKAKIHGTKGRITLDSVWHSSEGFTVTNSDEEDTVYQIKKIGHGYAHEIIECHRCLKEGRTESDKWTHQNSLELISITDRIREKIGLRYPFE